jgi:ABC-type multidrug transport system ATPase subunit
MGNSVLQLEELRKHYGETVALDGVSFTVEEGKMFGFVDPNGAGKTTLMRIVLGVLAADSDAVLWPRSSSSSRRGSTTAPCSASARR